MGSTIGSVAVAVVPDARDFWHRFENATRPGADEAGRDLGRGVREGMDEELARPVNVRVKADSSDVQKATAETNALRDAMVLVGPAAIPVAGVLAGAFAGAIPAAATLALGIKGIANEMKSGALAGTQYGKDIDSLKSELTDVQTIAAGGLLSGIDRALQGSGPLFKEVNSDVSQMSSQLGDIVASAGPALLSVFTQLNPLFVEFGQLITKGAAGLEHFAVSGTGLSSFVAYAQAELPVVEHTLAALAVTASHVVQALAPYGGVVLSDIGLLARAINDIPVGVLQSLAPVVISVYAAFRTFQGINSIVASVSRGVTAVSKAVTALKAPFVTSEAASRAAALQIQADAAAEAAAVAGSQAEQAEAAATAAAAIAASTEGTSSILAEGAAAAATSAAAEAAAFRAAASEAEESSVRIQTAASAAAETAEAEGAAAGIGFSAALGPVGAVIAGVGLLATTLLGSGGSARAAAADMDIYSESVKKSTDALSRANVQSTVDALSKKGAYQQLDLLTSGNGSLSLSYNDLTDAVNGSNQQYKATKASLNDYLNGLYASEKATNGPTAATERQIVTVRALLATLDGLRGGLKGSITQQEALKAATGQSTLALVTAKEQTAAYTKSLQALGQAEIAQIQTEDAFKEGLLAVDSAVKQNGKSLSDNTKGGLANRDMLANLASQALATANANLKNGRSIPSVTAGLERNVAQLERTAENAGLSRGKVAALIREMGLTPHQIETKFGIDQTDAEAKLAALKRLINGIPKGFTIQATVANAVQGGSHGHVATGGYISGPGTGTSDTAGLFALSNGEYVSTAKSTMRNHAALEAGNKGAQLTVKGYASGGDIVTLDHTSGGKAAAASRAASRKHKTDYIVEGKRYATLRAAENAAVGDARSVHLNLTSETKELGKFRTALAGTAAQSKATFDALIAGAEKLGAGKGFVGHLRTDNAELDQAINARNKAAANLKAIDQKMAAEKATVYQAVSGSFSIASSGTGFDGQQSVSFANIDAQAKQQSVIVGKWAAGIKKLGSSGFNKSATGKALLQQLAEGGPSDYPEVAALLQASPKQLAGLIATDRSIDADGALVGGYIGKDLYGSQAKAYAKDIHNDSKNVAKYSARIETAIKDLEKSVKKITIPVYLDGKKVASATAAGARKNARR